MDNNNNFIENNDNNSVENPQNETSKKKKVIIGAVVAAIVIIAVVVAAVMLTSNNDKSEGAEGTDGVSQSDVSNTQESTTVKPGEYVIVDTESTTGNSSGSNQNNSSSGNQNGSQSGGNSGDTSNAYNPDDSGDNDDDKEEVLVKRKVTAYIELPDDGGAADILEIYVNGKLQKFGEESGASVNINGKKVVFTTDKEYEGVVRIEAKLKKYGTSASQITTKNGDTVSFTLPLDSSEENFGQND